MIFHANRFNVVLLALGLSGSQDRHALDTVLTERPDYRDAREALEFLATGN